MLAAGLAAMGCARAEAPAIRGTATYRERMALPPGAVLAVALQDISRADAPAETLAEARIPIEGQVPVGFTLPYDPARILPHHSYAVRGTIELEGRVIFRPDTIHPVLTRGASETVELRLVRAAAPVAEAAAPLVGPDWVAEDIGGRGVANRVRSTLTFGADGRVSGSGGCNRIAGSYTLAGEALALRPDDLHHDGLRPGGGGAGAALPRSPRRDPPVADHGGRLAAAAGRRGEAAGPPRAPVAAASARCRRPGRRPPGSRTGRLAAGVQEHHVLAVEMALADRAISPFMAFPE